MSCLQTNPGNPPQTLTVQYDDVSALDGVTPSAAFSRDESDPDWLRPGADGIYRVPQNGPLGLIDPDLGEGGSMGDRYILWMQVVLSGSSNLTIEIVDAQGELLLETVVSQDVQQTFFRSSFFRVPQGGLIRISGQPGVSARVRLRISLFSPSASADGGISSSSGNTVYDPFAINALAFGVPNDGSDASTEIATLFRYASEASAENKRNQRVRFPTSDYTISSPILIPHGVEVWGDGHHSRFISTNGSGFIFEDIGFLDPLLSASLQHLAIHGPDFVNPVGIGVDMSRALHCSLRDVTVWDFLTGILLSDGGGGYYSAHNVIGHCEANRCRTGIYAGPRGNGNSIHTCRVFYSWGPANEGVGLDIDSAVALSVEAFTVDAADTCLRCRSTDFYPLIGDGGGFFLEPGSNPYTGQAGQSYDVDVDVEGSSLSLRAIYPSGSRAIARLDPEAQSTFDGPSQLFFGARYDGASTPKRNFVFNGMWQYFNAGIVPGVVSGSAPAPTRAQVQTPGDYVTGNRSLRLTSTGATGSVQMTFFVDDNSIRWITVGVRYRVEGTNTGFVFAVSAQGGGARQHTDGTPTPPGQWRIGYVTYPIDPANTNRNGSVTFQPDLDDGTGSVLIDEVWCVPGKFATPGTQYAERVEMLPAPIPIYTATLTSLTFFGPIDLTTLPSTLAPPFDDFSTAPYGLVGAVLRLTVTTDSGALGTALASFHGLLIDVPGVAGVVGGSFQRVNAQYSQIPSNMAVLVRDTTVTGLYYPGDGLSSDVEVALVGWLVA